MKRYQNAKILHWKYGIQKLVIGALRAESLLTEYLALIAVTTRKSDSVEKTPVRK